MRNTKHDMDFQRITLFALQKMRQLIFTEGVTKYKDRLFPKGLFFY